MLFGVVSGVGREIDVYMRWRSSEEGAVLGILVNVEHPIVTNGDLVA